MQLLREGDSSGQMNRRIKIELIEAYRYDRELGKTDFCKQVRVDIRTYNKLLEDPTCKVNDETIYRIARGIDKKPSEIVTWAGSQTG